MTDKKILWIRILIAISAFIVLSGTLISFFKNWSPGLIYTVLLILSFITLANGVSYISNISKNDRNYLKIATGIFSIIVFLFCLFPINRETNLLIQWIILIGLSLSSILISVFFLFDFTKINNILRWLFSFLFALNSGIYSFFLASMILRNYNWSDGGIVVIGYSAVLFLISFIVNLIAVSSSKNKIGNEQ
jgi:hypothetical protein